MLQSKRLLTLTVLLAAATAGLLYFRGQTVGLEQRLYELEARTERQTSQILRYDTLRAADSLFDSGAYARAAIEYDRMARDTNYASLAATLRSRTDHALRLQHYAASLDTLRRLASRKPAREAAALTSYTPRAVDRMPLEATRPDQYDSLTFALRKARMQIRNLEGRLRSSSEGNYLTFNSRRGNEVYYVGSVKKGKANGRGVALLSSGSRYFGEWRDNRRHGMGEFHWPDGAYYEGEYENDRRSGEGTYHFADGQTFVGSWEDDVRNGTGVFYDKSGEVVARGIWADDELVEEM